MTARTGTTAKAVAYITQRGAARTDELADQLGVNGSAIVPLLKALVDDGRLIVCKVERPGKPPTNEYRIGAGIPARATHAKPLGWRGQPYAINPDKQRSQEQPAVSRNTGSAEGSTASSARKRRTSKPAAGVDRAPAVGVRLCDATLAHAIAVLQALRVDAKGVSK